MDEKRKKVEILALAKQLIRIPSVTVGAEKRMDEVHRAAGFVIDYFHSEGLEVRHFDEGKYPAVLVGFPDQLLAPVMFSGHFDVVGSDPDDRQFEPYIDGDYLWGRGSADMKTALATLMVWFKDVTRRGPPYPKINLLLVGNEETGESEPMGTPFVLKILEKDYGYRPKLLIAGERTGENGDEFWGKICTQNRGILRFQVEIHGERGHTGTSSTKSDFFQIYIDVRKKLEALSNEYLTLTDTDNWYSQIRFPFVRFGIPGVYNITPEYGVMGIEIRAIPQDDIEGLYQEFHSYCDIKRLVIRDLILERGIICDAENDYLNLLLESVREVSGKLPELGRKLAGTSARFAPEGNGIVWGQSGIGPHSDEERHYIPSIIPYYRVLDVFGKRTIGYRRSEYE